METKTAFEIGVKGSDFDPIWFTHTWASPIHIGPHNNSRIFIQFEKHSCAVAEDREHVRCEKRPPPSSQENLFFVEQTVPNFDDQKVVFSPLKSHSLTMVYDYGSKFELTFEGARDNPHPEEDIQTLKIDFRDCSHTPNGLNSALFPTILKNYLRTRG